jgi:gamma-butyrobetaine dioxygenase
MELELAADHLTVHEADGAQRFHYVWLRDNCPCAQCRIDETGERRLFTADIPDGIAPRSASLDEPGRLAIAWNDGHESTFSTAWLARYDEGQARRGGRRTETVLWGAELAEALPRFPHDAVVNTVDGQLAYLDAMAAYGVAIVTGAPSKPGQVESFAETIGHVREVAFERVHNVEHDPAGYNAAHTAGELKPHTDLPSYHWPPSVQLLHFLTNQTTGGETVLVDGWRVLSELRRDDSEAFQVLASVPVDFQLFSEHEDTQACAPMVTLDAEGNVATFRFSNQLALPLDAPFDEVGPFYRAYRKLGRMLTDDAYRVEFPTDDGDLITVHGHRVLHGRLPYDPSSGARHLQDVYMEYDDLMARRRVLRGQHKPVSARPEVAA